jgi:hypothetical protein
MGILNRWRANKQLRKEQELAEKERARIRNEELNKKFWEGISGISKAFTQKIDGERNHILNCPQGTITYKISIQTS